MSPESSNFEEFTKILKEDGRETRIKAISDLAKLDDARAIPFLVKVLDSDPHLLSVVVEALGTINDIEAAKALFEVFDYSKEEHLKYEVVKALEQFDESIIYLLCENLLHSDKRVCYVVLRISVTLKREGYQVNLPIDDLIKLWKTSANTEIRLLITNYLALLRDPKVTEILIEILNNGDEENRRLAAATLKNLNTPRAIEPLFEAFQRQDLDETDRAIFLQTFAELESSRRKIEILVEALNDSSQLVIYTAIDCLKEAKDDQALNVLIGILQDKDREETIREKTANALGKSGEQSVIGPLLHILRDEPAHYLQIECAIALAELGDLRATDSLIEALYDKNPNVSVRAAEMLGKLGDLRAEQPLLKVLNSHKDGHVRAVAAKALGALNRENALTCLIQALKDEDWQVREAALKTLTWMKVEKPQLVEVVIETYRNSLAVDSKIVNQPLFLEDVDLREFVLDPPRNNGEYNVQAAAIELIGIAEDSRAEPIILEALQSEILKIRKAAIRALGQLNKQQAISILGELLQSNKEDIDLKITILQTLARIDNNQAIPYIQKTLEDKDFWRNKRKELRKFSRMAQVVLNELQAKHVK